MAYMAAGGVDNIILCEGRMNNLIYTTMLEPILMGSGQKKIGNTDRATIYIQQNYAHCHTSRVSRGCLAF